MHFIITFRIKIKGLKQDFNLILILQLFTQMAILLFLSRPNLGALFNLQASFRLIRLLNNLDISFLLQQVIDLFKYNQV